MKSKIIKISLFLVCLVFMGVTTASAGEKTYCLGKGGWVTISGIEIFVCNLAGGDIDCLYQCGAGQ